MEKEINKEDLEAEILKLKLAKEYIKGKQDGYNEAMDKAQEIFNKVFDNDKSYSQLSS
jgi:hypothetical protein